MARMRVFIVLALAIAAGGTFAFGTYRYMQSVPARAAEVSELRAELGAQLAEISPAQAKVLVLKHGFDFSFEEIAGAEGMPVGTAKCHAHRGRNGLRERLSA